MGRIGHRHTGYRRHALREKEVKPEAKSGWQRCRKENYKVNMSMDELRNFYLRQLQGRVCGIATELTRLRYSSLPLPAREVWHPAIDAYRCRDYILICAELAGVDRSQIAVAVEPRRVWLRGRRRPPEPRDTEGPALQVLALEIDHGSFEREIVLPVPVNPEQVEAEQREGLLWIRLPLAEQP
jgi:HSP20 family protein